MSLVRDRAVVAGLVAILWGVASGAWRQLVWQDVREGLTDLSPFERATRLVLRGGFALLLVAVVLLLASNVTRSVGVLLPLGSAGLVPLPLLPVTLLLLSFSWAFVLTGALGSHPLLRVVLLGVYLSGALGRVGLASNLSGSTWEIVLAMVLTLLIPVFALLRWRRALRGAPEFTVMLLLVGLNYAFAQREAIAQWSNTGVPLGLTGLVLNVTELGDLVAVLLLLVGLDIATFTRSVSGWAQEIAETRFPRALALLAFMTLLVVLAVLNGRELLGWTSEWDAPRVVGTLALPLSVPLLAFAAHALVRRWSQTVLPDQEELTTQAQRTSLPLVMAVSAPLLAMIVLTALVSLLLGLGSFFGAGVVQWVQGFPQLLSWLADTTLGPWAALVTLASVLFARKAARQGQVAVALYLTTFAFLEVRALLFQDGWLLAPFVELPSAGVRCAWLALVAGAAVWLHRRRELDGPRVASLLGVTVGVLLLAQESFIENPFSPMFGAMGAAFIGFSLVWDALTSGAWTNQHSPAFPRLGRVFLYLGYVLLVAALVNWSVTTHDLALTERFTGEAALQGFNRFGKPLVYAAFVMTLVRTLQRQTPSGT
ncbi:hypothetical protein [Deinococcus peraridilitoris]|uniref:Uncharacterized protein n=1 Tax=Deinococcus peraridilitoris (strain DSM 19664 / LMG 22246 / CIP 109416 / KR-200) TaxID=937777 RepID=L0A1G2_DEIPD|nr:hypothetical protein [Deinococcus peraridilitoris]AFZ67661.1 hypothetical protein Deipe_2175 [Deinococcus peraridilitoris DSM 19664]